MVLRSSFTFECCRAREDTRGAFYEIPQPGVPRAWEGDEGQGGEAGALGEPGREMRALRIIQPDVINLS